MALTYGFFNSIEGDRKYSALEFGSIFDGIIEDGVYQSIGDKFKVTSHNVENDMRVYVGTGRAWFLHTWTLNTADKAVTVPASEVLLPRIDALVLDIDHRENYRRNAFKIIKGTPNSSPQRPSGFANLPEHKEIPLAFITVPAKATYIKSSDIVNVVGKVSQGGPPFVVGVLEVADLSTIYAHIEAQWAEFYASATGQMGQIQTLYNNVNSQYTSFVQRLNELIASANNQINSKINELNFKIDTLVADANRRVDQLIQLNADKFERFLNESQDRFNEMLEIMEYVFKDFLKVHTSNFNDFVDEKNNEFEKKMDGWDSDFSSFWVDIQDETKEYLEAQKDVWENWFKHIQGQLSDDAATNLQREIDALSFAYILGKRAILGITASAIHKRVVFGTYGSVANERVMITAPSRNVIWVFKDTANLSITATVVHDKAIVGTYGGVTDNKLIMSAPTWQPVY